jgi:hypothetical protein
MAYPDRIIEKFGGTRPMAGILGIPASTVNSWKDSGVIPAKRHRDVLDAAHKNGIPLSPLDFFETYAEPAERPAAFTADSAEDAVAATGD